MMGRFVIGLLKGLFVGVAVGLVAAKLGLATPGPLFAYLFSAGTGALTGLLAGKPIWAAEAKTEAGLKALFGALLGAGLMFALRKWALFQLPLSLGPFGGPNTSLGDTTGNGTFGGVMITALSFVATVLSILFEVDNTPDSGPKKELPPSVRIAQTSGKSRVTSEALSQDQYDDEAPRTRAKRG